MDIPILFQDKDLVVFQKPAGVVVNEAISVQGETVQGWFEKEFLQGRGDEREERNGERNEAYGAQEMSVADWSELVPTDFSDEYGSPEEIFAERKGMVHRIDKDTSGILVFAKNPGSLVNLLAQFRMKEVKKQYVCLVHGKVQPEKDVIRAPLGRATGKDRRRFQVRSDGRPAETVYEVLSHWPALSSANFSKELVTFPSYQQGFSLVKAFPQTGRTHQIRVHFAHMGYPLVGDSLYAGKKRVKADVQWCSRHFLHASEISLLHPRTGEVLHVIAPLPDDLQSVLTHAFADVVE